MRLREIVEKLGFSVRSGGEHLDREVTGGYASDLVSDVIAHAREGDLWMTLQTHKNTVAVAAMKDLVGIVIVNGREPEEDALAKAVEEGIPILVTDRTTFETVGRLYGLGLRAGG